MFKKCNTCKHIWETRRDFIDDENIVLIGYQANFMNLEAGHLYFNHNCKNTIVLSTDQFTDLYNGPIFSESKTGTDECPQFCLRKEELKRCTNECECAYVRDIIQMFDRVEHIKFV